MGHIEQWGIAGCGRKAGFEVLLTTDKTFVISRTSSSAKSRW
jgi:hypothetical protein